MKKLRTKNHITTTETVTSLPIEDHYKPIYEEKDSEFFERLLQQNNQNFQNFLELMDRYNNKVASGDNSMNKLSKEANKNTLWVILKKFFFKNADNASRSTKPNQENDLTFANFEDLIERHNNNFKKFQTQCSSYDTEHAGYRELQERHYKITKSISANLNEIKKEFEPPTDPNQVLKFNQDDL